MTLWRAAYLTDEQWMTLLTMIENEARWQLRYPAAAGESVRGIDPDGERFVIKADGTVVR